MTKESDTTTSFAKRLLAWFDLSGRHDLPWQQDKTPYRVWLSEIMLQQTQVQTVIPYFEAFIQSFPTIQDLACASEDEVLHLWTGLGYYARARNLHRTAQRVTQDLGGHFPRSVEELEELPGIGRSTAGAIASLAMGLRAPILDGNVKRVIARHDAVAGWPGSAKTLTELWRLSEQYTPHERVDDYTQGVMDLGATVCTRQNPHCTACPVRATCRAFQRGEQTHYPGRKRRKTLPERQTCFLILQRPDGAVLLEKRPSPGIWGGLWCFPETAAPERTPATLEPLLPHGQQPLRALDSIQHSFSHYRLTILPFIMAIGQPTEVVAEVDSVRWVRPGSDVALGLPAPVSQILDRLLHQQ